MIQLVTGVLLFLVCVQGQLDFYFPNDQNYYLQAQAQNNQQYRAETSPTTENVRHDELRSISQQEQIPRTGTNDIETITDSVIWFSWNLFKIVSKANNIAVSPLAPQLLLAYLSNAADGRTKQQLTTAIRGLSPADLDLKLKDMLGRANSNNFISIKTAFYVDNTVVFNPNFKQQAAVYDIGTFNVNMRNPVLATQTINDWISKTTKGLIKQAVSPQLDTSNVRLMLVNTIAFNGVWKKPFTDTKLGNFEVREGNFKPVTYMNKVENLFAGIADLEGPYRAIWVEIPYDANEYSMYLFIPNERFHMEHMIKHMSLENLKRIVFDEKTDARKQVNLTMPRFKLESIISLKAALIKMGIRDLFSSDSNLPYMATDESLQVADAMQTVLMDVDERGTKAAAATTFNVITLSLSQDPMKFDLIIDQPFLAMIVDNKNKVPLFMAKIDNP